MITLVLGFQACVTGLGEEPSFERIKGRESPRPQGRLDDFQNREKPNRQEPSKQGEKGKYRGWGGAGVEVGGAKTTTIWKGLFR